MQRNKADGLFTKPSCIALFCLDPRRHLPKLFSHFFNEMFLISFAERIELRTVCLVFQYPFFSKLSVLDLSQNFLHLISSLFCDNPSASGEISIFSRIAY